MKAISDQKMNGIIRRFKGQVAPLTAPKIYHIETEADFKEAITQELATMTDGTTRTILIQDASATYARDIDTGLVRIYAFDGRWEGGPINTAVLEIVSDRTLHMLAQLDDDRGVWELGSLGWTLTTEIVGDFSWYQGTTAEGWTFGRWDSGKLEAWKWFNSNSHNPPEDLGEGNYFRYLYTYHFDLPYESMTTPHIFVSLRSSGRDLLVGVTPEEGRRWYTWESLDIALQKIQMEELGRPMENVTVLEELRTALYSHGGVTSSEFSAALKACNGDANKFFVELTNYASTGSDDVNAALAAVNLTRDIIQMAFDNTKPSRGSISQSFTVLSPYNDSEHLINAEIHVIGTWK